MAGHAEKSLIPESRLQPLNSLPSSTQPARVTNPIQAQPMPSFPVRLPPPSRSGPVLESKFDQLGDDDNGDFTDKVINAEFPADWGDDVLEIYDENGWNLLHYSVLKGYSNAVTVLVEDLDFDVNVKTRLSIMTPLELALEKCCECVNTKTSVEPFFGIAETILMKSPNAAIGAGESVLRFAVNFPVYLKKILTHHPEFYQCRGDLSPLTGAIKLGLVGKYEKMGFFELLLQQNVDDVVLELISNDPEYVKAYVCSGSGETPLHTAAKLGNDVVVIRLMKSRLGEHMYNKPDRRYYTPIITAMVHYHLHKEKAIIVIKEILSHLCTFSDNCATCISAIKQLYGGLPVIEQDIRSGEAIILQAIMKLDKDNCQQILGSQSFSLGNIFHLAARYGLSLKVFQVDDGERFNVKCLEGGDDVDANSSSAKPWPCDYAVQYDHVDFLEEAWKCGREDWSHEIETACRFGNLDALIFLTSRTKNPLNLMEYRKLLCIACRHGQASIVEYCLETVKVSPTRYSDDKNPTALMLAADNNAVDCVKLLLDHNANVRDVDTNGYNALCRAILLGKKKAVMAILTHPIHSERALRFCTKPTANVKPNITPMRLLVKRMPDVAKWVLNEQIVYESSTGKITYKYDLIDDFDPDNIDFHGPIGTVLRRLRPLRQGADQADAAGNAQYNSLNDNASNGSGTDDYKPTKYKPYNHMLNVMVRSKSLDILDHLLVRNVIDHYWRYIIVQWIVLRSVYLFITIMLTAFTLVLPHPNERICRGDKELSGGRNAFLIFSSIMLILSSLLSLLITGYTLFAAKYTVFLETRFRVLFEAVLPFLILLFVIGYGNDSWCAQNWQWNVGAFCTCLSWLSLLVTLKGFRLTASPINMLFAIIKRFLLIIYVPILLIAAFALPFYMLFNKPLQSSGPYRDIGATLGTLTILFTGDGDYDERFNSDEEVDFPFASYFMYFLFVIMVGILFNNLLVSLAVGEVGDLQENAKLEQYRLNIEAIIDGLEFFFPFIRPLGPKSFDRPTGIQYKEDYLEAESEWKKAQAENMEFVNQILEEESGEVIQRKIDRLEATLLEKIRSLQQQIQELAPNPN